MRYLLRGALSVTIFVAAWLFTACPVRHSRVDERPGEMRAEGIEAEATHAREAMQWFNNQRAYPAGIIPLDWKEKAIRHVALNNFQKSAGTNFLSWISVGPSNLGGRVRSILVNPVNPNTIYCGSVSGGVWKSTNAGGTWFPTTDAAPSLVICSMVMDPTDTNTIYAGTGEGFQNIDALRGVGVLKTTNGGGTWALLNNFQPAPPNGFFVNKLAIRPDNPSVLLAGMVGGVWKTTNGGALWNKLSVPSTSTACTDFVINPVHPDTAYASFGLQLTDGIYRTANGGTSWSPRLANGFPPTSDKYHRISLAISQSNPAILYASVSDSNDGTHSVQKTTNGGTSWFTVASRAPYDDLLHATHLGNQGWYNNVIAVHPTNPDLVYAGGINTFRSTDGGVTWSMMTYGYSGSSRPFMHVDNHAMTFDPTNPSIIYFGNDGGVYRTADGGNSVSNINNNLSITQFYSGAVHPTNEIYYGGSQDIGLMKSATVPVWTVPFIGDGGVTLVDFNTPTTVYSEYVFLAILKSVASGAPGTWTKAMTGIPQQGSSLSDGASDRCDFISPIAMDPSNPQILLAGTYRVFRSTNGGDNWSAISGDLTGDGPGAQKSNGSVVTAMTIAKSSSSTIYVGTGNAFTAFGSGTGATASRILVTTNTGTIWSNVTTGTLPNRYVRAIAVDPDNASRAFVCYSGYGTGHVFRTLSRGAAWTNVSSNLPDVPVNAIVIDPGNTNHIIIGTDIGIFESTDDGGSWVQQNTGLADVCVIDLDLRADGYLFASTHGRGMFKSSAPIGSAISPHLTVSIHQNPILTRYVDVYLISDTALSPAPPSARIRIGNTVNDSLTMTLSSPQVFKGSYEFTASGSATLTFAVNDTAGNLMYTQRLFQVQFLKQGVPQTVRSSDGIASVDLGSEAIDQDMFLTIAPDEKTEGDFKRVGPAYIFGPERRFPKDLTIAFRYGSSDVEAGKERHLSIMSWDGTGWVRLESNVDAERRVVSARTSLLGTFTVGYNADWNSNSTPTSFVLMQNYPNPFNPATTIRYTLPERGRVTLAVYTVAGQLVKTLDDGPQEAGEHSMYWEGRAEDGASVASGVYFYRLLVSGEAGVKFNATRKMVIVK